MTIKRRVQQDQIPVKSGRQRDSACSLGSLCAVFC